MSESEIKDLLQRAGDDRGHPLHTDPGELLDRARRDVGRRRRVRSIVGSLAAAAIVAVVILVPLVSVDRTTPPAARPNPGPVLSAATVVERCRPQLAKYAGLTGYDSDPVAGLWHLNHEGRRYRAGDLVQLGEQGGDDGDPVLCVIPRPGHEQDPVGFEQLTPVVGQIDLLRAVCAEQANMVGDGGIRIPDLRRATVLATGFVGRVGAALLRGPDGYLYGCSTAPPSASTALAGVDRVPGRGLDTRLRSTGPATAPTSEYAVVLGRVPAPVRKLEVTWAGGPTTTSPVRGGYVAAVSSRGASDALTYTWRLLDSRGRQVDAGTYGDLVGRR